MDPTIGSALIGVAGGLLQKGPKVPRNVQHIQRMQMLAMKGMSDFANSTPLSDPMERMALAQSRGLLGQEQMGQRDALYSQINPMTDAMNQGDLLSNLSNQQVGQRMNLSMSHLFEALNSRRAAMGQITGMGNQSMPAAGFQGQQSGPDFGSIFGNLASMYAEQKARRPNTLDSGAQNDLARLLASSGSGGGGGMGGGVGGGGGMGGGVGGSGVTTLDPVQAAQQNYGSRF
jgi:hypothetical protein